MKKQSLNRQNNPFKPSSHLEQVSYEIRGPLDQRAQELEKQGYEIFKLNIGNPAAFGFRAPNTMLQAMIENLSQCSGYSPSKGIFSAREAIVMSTQEKGIKGLSIDDVFLGNGVSELIMMSLEALLEPGDEVLVPAPDYPLWSAAVRITGAQPVFYSCPSTNKHFPDPSEIKSLIGPRTRAIVIINPNNPTGAVYPKSLLKEIVTIAAKHQLLVFSDEIYDKILYDKAVHTPTATLCEETLCCTFNGLSKVYRAAGFRTGWMYFSGDKTHAKPYLKALELLASLRLCSNVPGQWAVQTALGGKQSIYDLTAPTGRLGKQRKCVIDAVKKSPFLSHQIPQGALYSFIKVDTKLIPQFNDHQFAMNLLENHHVLVVPGSSFNVEYKDHFRVTFLPDEDTLSEVFMRIDLALSHSAQGD